MVRWTAILPVLLFSVALGAILAPVASAQNPTWYQIDNGIQGQLLAEESVGSTSFELEAGQGAAFPSVFPFVVVLETGPEVCIVTNRVGDVLTVTRAQEGTSAVTQPAGADVSLAITAGVLQQVTTVVDELIDGTRSFDVLDFTTSTTNVETFPTAGADGTAPRASSGGLVMELVPKWDPTGWATGKFVKFNASGDLVVADDPTIASFADLPDVIISGPTTDDIVAWNGSAWVDVDSATLRGGQLDLGISDTTAGALILSGNAASQSGSIIIEMGGADDSLWDYYKIETLNDDLRIENPAGAAIYQFIRTGSNTGDFLTSGDIAAEGGEVRAGKLDNTRGTLRAYGDSGTTSGQVSIESPADWDSLNNEFSIYIPSANTVGLSDGGGNLLWSVVDLGTIGGFSSGQFIAAASSTAQASFRAPPGVAPTSPVDGDIWTETTGLYARIDGGTVGPYGTSSVSAFDDLSDVIISTPAPGQVLEYNGAAWVNLAAAWTNAEVADDLTVSSSGSVDSTALTDGGTISFDWVDAEIADDLTIASSNKIVGPAATTGTASFNAPPGVAPTSPVDGDIWTTATGMYARIDGGTVGPFSAGAGVSAFNDLSDVVIGGPVLNDLVVYNGSNWGNAGGTIGIGRDDVSAATLNLFAGAGASKTSINIHNAADEDGTTEKFVIIPQSTGNALEFYADAVELMQIARSGANGQLTVYEAVSAGQSIFMNGEIDDAALSSTVAHLNAAETITGNWINTANPWGDAEVSNDLTIDTNTKINADDVSLSGILQYDETNPTISSGSITVTSAFVTVSAESAGVDNLDTITAAGTPGEIIYLGATFGHTITVREVGNLQLAATTRVLTVGDTLALRAVSTVWVEVSYANNN